MMKKTEWMDRKWPNYVRLLKITALFFAMILCFNIWTEFKEGRTLDASYLLYGTGFIVWIGVLYVVSRLIFKFIRAKALHDEQRS
jgi:hypothetical protein